MLFQRSLIEAALLPIIPAPIAHYTRIGNLRHFISGSPPGWGSAWATPVQFLNDRKELSLGLEILQRVANQPPLSGQPPFGQAILTLLASLRDTHGGLETDAFQMSFSGNPDELGQWRGYGADGMGCSIVTDALTVHGAAHVAGWVIYDTASQEAFARQVLDDLRHETGLSLIGQALVAAASFMKHKGFAAESEFRLLRFPGASEIEFRETGDRLVPYIDYLKFPSPQTLKVSKILIGPGWQLSDHSFEEFARNHVVQPIARLLSVRGLTTTVIESSSIPYDPR